MIYRIASNKIFKAYFMEKDFDGARAITPREFLAEIDNPKRIVGAKEITDQIVLESLRHVAESTPRFSPTDLMSVVADKILCLGLKDGGNLVLPVTGVLMRSMRDRRTIDEERLAERLARLKEASGPSNKARLGIALGDTAALCAAGYVGSRYFGKVTGVVQNHTYARDMAEIGYGTAVNFGPLCESRTKTTALSVKVLTDRFRGAVDVLTQVLGTEEFASIRQRESLKGIAPAIG